MATVAVAGGSIDVRRVGSGPELFILHSLLTDREAFREVLPTLAASYRVNLVDLPGFGGSSPCSPAVEAFADRISEILPPPGSDGDSVVLGNGLGAFVALALAARHGNRFDRLVLLGTGPGFPEEARDTFRTLATRARNAGMAAVVDAAVPRIFPDTFMATHPGLIDERRRVLLELDPESFAQACEALARLDLAPVLPSVSNPTLVIVGELDEATPPVLGRAVVDAIDGAEMIELAGCGHCPQLEQPENLLSALAPFLDLTEPTQ